VNELGASAQALTGSFTTEKTKPGPALTVTATALAGGVSVDLTWRPPADNGGEDVTYDVYTLSGDVYDANDSRWLQASQTTVNGTSKRIDTGLKKGSLYSFKVVARNSKGDSTGVVAKATTRTTVPGGVRELAVEPLKTGTGAAIEWVSPQDMGGHAALGYEVYTAENSVSDPDSDLFTLAGTAPATGATDVNTTVAGLKKGALYTFKVVPVGTADGGERQEGPARLIEATMKTTAPVDVRGLTGSALDSGTQVELRWTALTAADDIGGELVTDLTYDVYRHDGEVAADAAGDWTLVETGLGNGVSECDVSGLNKYSPYTFKVVARNSKPSAGSVVTLATQATVPADVTTVAAVVEGQNVTLTWNASSDAGAFGAQLTYRVYRYDTPTSENGGRGELLDTFGPSDRKFEDEGLAKGKTYTYTVTADNGVASESLGKTAYAPIAKTAPSPVEDLVAEVAPGSAYVMLTWTEPLDKGGYDVGGEGGLRYEVYRVTGAAVSHSDPSWVLLCDNLSAPGYDDYGPTRDVDYSYMVVAKTGIAPDYTNGGRVYAFTEKTVRVASLPPSAVGTLDVEPDSDAGKLSISWDEPDAAAGYRIYKLSDKVPPPLDVTGAEPFAVVTQPYLFLPLSVFDRGLDYTLAVQAYNNGGDASPSAVFYTRPIVSPSAVSGAAVQPQSEPGAKPTVTLSWPAPDLGDDRPVVGDTISYLIYRITTNAAVAPKFDESTKNGFELVARLNADGTPSDGTQTVGAQAADDLAFVDRTVEKDKTYWYYVVTENATTDPDTGDKVKLHSDYGDIDPKRVEVPATAPSPARSLGASAVGTTSVNLSWTAPEDDGGRPVTYDVYRVKSESASAPGMGGTALRAGLTGTFYTDTGLSEDTQYWYFVVAKNGVAGACDAAVKNVKTTKTPVVPPTPVDPPPDPAPAPAAPAPAPAAPVYPDVGSIKTPITKLSVVAGKKLNLKKMVGMYDSASKLISDPGAIWASSKPNVAAVSASGALKAGKKPGKAVISLTAQNGKSLKITITVVKKAKKLKKLTGKVPALKVGKPAYITLKGAGTNITGYKWKVKGKGMKIDKFGMATATKKGKYTITVTAGGKKWVKKVTVK
jgi:hypothetical protein